MLNWSLLLMCSKSMNENIIKTLNISLYTVMILFNYMNCKFCLSMHI